MRHAALIPSCRAAVLAMLFACAAAGLAGPSECAASASGLLPLPSSALVSKSGVLDRAPVARGVNVTLPAGSAVVSAERFLTDKAAGVDLLAQRAIRDAQERSAASPAKRSAQPKHPGRAAFFSAVVPGTGELYSGSKRGFIFMGIEAIAWYGYFTFDAAGDDKEVEFERYADRYWQIDSLEARWSRGECEGGLNQEDIDRLMEFKQTNEQHYYEDLGKLEAFACGWINPQNRETYRGIRRESNRLLTNARRAKTIAFINHIASAVDAFLLAKRYNRSLGQGVSMKVEMVADLHNPRGKVTFTRRFY